MTEGTPMVSPVSPAPLLQEPEIQVIPEKYYGAALRASVETVKVPASSTALVQPTHSRNAQLIVAVAILIVVVVGGAFVYFNRQRLFVQPTVVTPKPQVAVQTPPLSVPPTPIPLPAAATGVTVTSTTPQSASIAWIDPATNETGFRLERAETTSTFQALTTLPSNSTSFLDVSVQPGVSYRYRIIAFNQTGEASPSSEVTVQISKPPVIPETPKLPPAGLDTDSDGLSDLEEGLFGTDIHNPDTDSDGFLDGNEVFHLYNPNGRAPAKLTDAGLVKPFVGSSGWVLQIPRTWSAIVARDGLSAKITSGHGEVFTLSIEANSEHLSLLDWYLKQHPSISASQALRYRSKRGYEGIIGADLLTTYLQWGDRIVSFTYDLGGQPFINYRTTYSMMLNSLELSGVPQIFPPEPGTPLPFEPAATATGVVTQPVPLSVFPSSEVSTGTTASPVESPIGATSTSSSAS